MIICLGLTAGRTEGTIVRSVAVKDVTSGKEFIDELESEVRMAGVPATESAKLRPVNKRRRGPFKVLGDVVNSVLMIYEVP